MEIRFFVSGVPKPGRSKGPGIELISGKIIGGGQMISEKTLRQWRREALKPFDKQLYDTTEAEHLAVCYADCKERILHLTAELLDLTDIGGDEL